MTPAEKREARLWPLVASALIAGGILLAAAIQGGALHV